METIVPASPRRRMYMMFLTKFHLFKVYPAAKIMGGRMK